MKENNRSLLFPLAFVLTPLLINGFYNPYIAKIPVLYWTVEIITWVLLPGLALWLLRRNDSAHLKSLFSALPLKSLILIIFVAPFFHIALFIFDLYLRHWIPHNYFAVSFSYESLIPPNPVRRFLISVYFSASAAIVEEIFFRGIPLTLFAGSHRSRVLFVLLTSSIFSLGHWEQGVIGMIITLLWGVIFSGYFLKYRSLFAPIILHFTVDFLWFFFSDFRNLLRYIVEESLY